MYTIHFSGLEVQLQVLNLPHQSLLSPSIRSVAVHKFVFVCFGKNFALLLSFFASGQALIFNAAINC